MRKKIKIKMEQRDYMVCVKCWTFNQSVFIRDTLDGFCMQTTDFPYVCAIIDDASTDGEQDVIDQYLHDNFDLTDKEIVREEETNDYVLKFAKHKINANCFFSVLFLKYNHYNIKKSSELYLKEWTSHSVYTAFCEGDDYWTDSQKLQKQIDFLEEHKEYVLSCHRFSIYDYENNRFETDGFERLFNGKRGITFDNRYDYWITKTLALVYRTGVCKDYSNYPGEKRDRTFVYFLMKKGLGYCFNDNMGVYRKSLNGVFGKKTNYQKALDRYRVSKQLYDYDKNSITRYRYYIPLLQVLYYSHGKDISKLSFKDLLYFPLFVIIYLFKRLKGNRYIISE